MMTSSETSLRSDLRVQKGQNLMPDFRSVSPLVWLLLSLTSIATFAIFLIFDPDPNLVLSVCVAANVLIMGWAMVRMYQLDLLLSPMMLVYIGPPMVAYYSLGNLGARIAGEGRYAGNFRTLEYYPQVALLSTIGLIMYCLVVFGLFQKYFKHKKIRFQDLYWSTQQLFGAVLMVITILVYLSLKYNFIGGYFRGAESNFDRWLVAAMNAFVYLIAIISVSLLAQSKSNRSRVFAFLGVIIAVILSIGLRSRTFIVLTLILMTLCWITLKPRHTQLPFFLLIAFVGIASFIFGTVIKSQQSTTYSVFDNLFVFNAVESSDILSIASRNIGFDRQYRASGFEYPAAVLRCLDNGADPAYGKGLLGAFYQGIPGFMRPSGTFSERGSIALHYWRYCLFYDDSISIPLLSGIGDLGTPGVLIYFLLGLFSLLLWKVAQSSPRLFVAYLLVPVFPDYLFWSGVFHYTKMMVFLWIILWIMGPILMPRWLPPSDAQVNA